MDLQTQYDLIYSYFRTTTEAFDFLEWDGTNLLVILNEKVIEVYSLIDLKEIINL